MMMMTRKKFTFSNALLPSTGVSSSADTYETMAPNAKDDNNFDIMLIIFYQKNKKAFFFLGNSNLSSKTGFFIIGRNCVELKFIVL